MNNKTVTKIVLALQLCLVIGTISIASYFSIQKKEIQIIAGITTSTSHPLQSNTVIQNISSMTPNFGCIGSCPTGSPTVTPPGGTSPSGSVTQTPISPSAEQTPTSPQISGSPRCTTAVNVQTVKRKSKHKSRNSNGLIRQFINLLLNLIMKLLEVIKQLLDHFSQQPNPSGSPQPSNTPVPCPSNPPQNAIVPSGAQPNKMVSVPANPTGSVNPGVTGTISQAPNITPGFNSGLFLGANVDMMNMLPGTPYTIKTATGGDFFDQALQLGINTIRITDTQSNLGGAQYSQTQWQQVMNRALQTHMHVILLTQNLSREKLLLGTYGLTKSPALWMIDVENEPDVCGSISGLQQEITYAHQVAPGIPATIGGWKCGNNWQNPADLTKIISIVDIVAAHKYGFTTAFHGGTPAQTYAKQEFSALRQYAQGKKIFLEEFGANNGQGATGNDAAGTPQTQAQIYQGVFREIAAEKGQGVIGATAWSYSTRKTGTAENSDLPWAFVLQNGAQLLPAAQTFAAFK